MRRFSQRNSLVTLNEINITPLLDLAFVLLIIFVITRPMLEQSMDLNLPGTGAKIPREDKVTPRDIQTVEIAPNGMMRLGGRPMANVAQIEKELKAAYASNQKMVVNIRADKRAPFDYVFPVIWACQKNGITRLAIQAAPEK